MRPRRSAAGELAASDRAPQPPHPWVAAAGRLCSPTGSRLSGSLQSPDFLNVEQFPTITFKSTRVERAAHDHYKMTGDLTIRNVTRPVTLDVVYSGQARDPMGGVHAGFSASTAINRKDWGLTWNVALETGGLLVSEEVKLALEVEVIKAAEAAAVA